MRHALRNLGLGAIVLSLSAAACGGEAEPPGQILLHVTTDAPLPPAAGTLGGGTLPLFDRLRVEIYPPGAQAPCEGCSREFAIDEALVKSGKASIGVVPQVGSTGSRIRLRLFRSGGTTSGAPRRASTLETVVQVPAIETEGIIDMTVTLWTDQLGKSVGTLEAPSAPTLGTPQSDLVGSWPNAVEAACKGSADAFDACVMGGAFWMGDPQLNLDTAFDMDGGLERLVVMSPFFLDKTEVTVSAFRASGLAESLTAGGPSDNPHEAGRSIAHCTYTSEPGAFEDYPVNCVSWHMAKRYCESLGKELPTEAQLEFASSGRRSQRYVWGEDEPSCGGAVFGRGALLDPCATLGTGPAAVGSGARDRLALSDGVIVDLAGNVQEWAADMWNRETESCWQQAILDDPLCEDPSATDGPARSIRGGNWDSAALGLRAAVRSRLANETRAVSANLGFRCARKDSHAN